MNIKRSRLIALPELARVSVPELYDIALRLLPYVFILASAILSGWWLTQLTAPRPVGRLPAMPTAPQESSLDAIVKLFGVGEARSSVDGDIQLAGIFMGSRGGGFATFHTRKGAISAFQGDEVVPGVQLKRLERDRVILLSAGMQRELPLREAGGSTSAAIDVPPVVSERPGIPNTSAMQTPQQASQIAAKPHQDERK